MPIVITSVDSPSVMQAVFRLVPITIDKTNIVTGITATEVYKTTLSFNDIGFIRFKLTAKEAANGCDVEIKIGGVSKLDDDSNADGTVIEGEIDCSAISGTLALVVECNNDTAGQDAWIEDLSFWHREA